MGVGDQFDFGRGGGGGVEGWLQICPQNVTNMEAHTGDIPLTLTICYKIKGA